MTNPHLTHLYFLLDRSGSMQSIREDTIGGFNAFIADQRRHPGDCRVTLAQFDNQYEVVYRDKPIGDVPGLDLQPRGTTALLDAIGRLVTDAGAQLASLPEPERPGTVIVGIMTDGYENASREWTHPAIRALIQQQTTTYSWEFLYLGADQDAIEVGTSLGVAANRSMTYARDAAGSAMRMTSYLVGRVRTARVAGAPAADIGYTEQERRESAGEPSD
ncbi:vWA domain-containing protein [Raineyella sp. W15-4]|uniref:vWA domain-containing protein n=1 Tax=Raineyella sp. W15-4 TaxID=3081651 RepID=UPI00295460ED|nr:vWA domain-containing protein [Raineyella sp. W15-4]WOQ18737.1 vWA domain-containing protein [Raineyella sp. W15-4]